MKVTQDKWKIICNVYCLSSRSLSCPLLVPYQSLRRHLPPIHLQYPISPPHYQSLRCPLPFPYFYTMELNPIEIRLVFILSAFSASFLLFSEILGAEDQAGLCAHIITTFSFFLFLVTIPVSLCMCVKVICVSHQQSNKVALQVVQEYERAVIFRLGRLRAGGAKGPGLFFIMPCIDTYKKVDLRTVSFDVPPQEVIITQQNYWSILTMTRPFGF